MTCGAVRKYFSRDTGVLVADGDGIGLVVVATEAGIFCVSARMAFLAICFAPVAMVKWEIVNLKLCWRPCLGSMAVLAFETKKSSMNCGFRVALNAFGGRAGELFLHMAF